MNFSNMQRAPPTNPYEKITRILWGKYKYAQGYPLALVIRPKEVSIKLKCHFHLPGDNIEELETNTLSHLTDKCQGNVKDLVPVESNQQSPQRFEV